MKTILSALLALGVFGAVPQDDKNACDLKKVVKGLWCVKCRRVLDKDDVRRDLCKKCEEKPVKIEFCVKSTSTYSADCHPDKTSDKPVS